MYLVMFLELNCCHVREISLKCLMLKGSVHGIVILCVCIYIYIFFGEMQEITKHIFAVVSLCYFVYYEFFADRSVYACRLY